MYYLQKEGIRLAEVFGHFAEFDDAAAAADFAASHDLDDYHKWHVYECKPFDYTLDYCKRDPDNYVDILYIGVRCIDGEVL